jgi:serine/threonine protein kinase
MQIGQSMALKPGDILETRYRLVEPLGRGGMSEVWGAVDGATGEEVALKILRKGAGPYSEIGRRMIREGELMRSIQSRHVCALLGSGMGEGRLFLVFERLHGESLLSALRREGSLAFDEVGWIGEGLFEGLSDAHRAGVIHRDLTPANVFLQDRGSERLVRLLDFGISKSAETMGSITEHGGTLGTWRYMPPEQAQAAHEADERADIYSAGTILFECLAGRLPFEAPEPYVAVSLKESVDAPSLGDVTGETWPSDLERFLHTCLARARTERFPSALVALSGWRSVVARNEVARSRRSRSVGHVREDTGTETMTAAPRTLPRPRPKRKS